MIRVSSAQRAQIEHHGEAEFPYECCGVILGEVAGNERRILELRPLENVHQDGHERRYLISPDQMFALMREERKTGRKILGFYHSHPNHPALPSVYDRDWASPWYTYIIVSVMNGKAADFTAWQLDDDREKFSAESIQFE